MNVIDSISAQVAELELPEFLSPYALAKVAGVRPQMAYNYIRKGYISATSQDGSIVVERAEAERWLVKYLARKALLEQL